MAMTPQQEALICRVFDAYLSKHHHDDILLLVDDDGDETHHPVVVNAMTLFEVNMEVGDFFNMFPDKVLAMFDEVLQKKAVQISEDASSGHKGGQKSRESRLRRTLHARITGLPVCPELTRHTIPRSKDVGHFLSVTGTVIRTSVAKVLEYERDYMCTKCRHVFKVHADFDQFYTFSAPVSCPNPSGCNSMKFSSLSEGSEPAACRDYQEIKIQEQVQRLSVGSIPRSLVVILEDDLVDGCKSGDDVTIYGVMCLRWKPLYDGTRCEVELVLRANNLEVNNQQTAAAQLLSDAQKEFEEFWSSYEHDPMAGRNQILLSLCPQVFGMYVVKLAVAMVLAGGVQRVDPSGTRIRGECHMLLVGDPGTGKSQFLKYAAKITPRSVLTAGIGSTNAGLTVAAVKDGGEWHLEAGALVLSDGGLCCIDEFNSIKEHDRISIHEAMEQQSISVAKAGMVCKLNTRTTILAATNPKGQYDPNEPLSVNVALASPLLSRFDLVLVLLDNRNAEWDRVISSFILEEQGLPAEHSALWSMEKMKAYFCVIKQLQPQVCDQANLILTRYYQLQRQSDGRNAARTTIRMLESLSRLAEAHARLMFRETVTIEDAVVAVSIMECSMQGGALLGNVNALLTSFPADPVDQYRSQCRVVLEGLNLPSLLRSEMGRLSRLRSSEPSSSAPSEPKSPPLNGDWETVSPPLYGSPIFTSTQEVNRKSGSSDRTNHQTEGGARSDTASTFHHPNVLTPSENLNIPLKRQKQTIKEKTQRTQKPPEGFGSTVPKTPKPTGTQEVTRSIHGDSAGGRGGGDEGNNEEQRSDLQFLGKHGQDRTESKSISAALSEKMVVEASTNLHSKLSGFTFKPRKTMAAMLKDSAPHQETAKTAIKRIQSLLDDEPRNEPTNAKKRRVQTAEGAVSEEHSRRRQDNGEGRSSSSGRVFGVTSSGKDKGEPGDDSEKIECPERGQSNPVSAVGDPGGQKKNSVAASAFTKLSRFSFTGSTEHKAAQELPEREEDADSLRADPEERSRRRLSDQNMEVDSEHQEKQDGPKSLGAVAPPNQSKRKCFQFRSTTNSGPSPRLLTGLSLFESVDVNNDVLDTDWDQEISSLKTDL
ncbi:DNA helicase MCM9 [Oryzias melastigma]|uniref:DNA helicase MCM9 n=1 Tax=Oryzias melastigma TaxID=30732 RepID=A0A3B3C1L0_ORYME|nr:DNA helicase MCM9 [Oryzias melastigma]XP_024147244.1 DNA helicase MCM9 [Oryzias melastigma]